MVANPVPVKITYCSQCGYAPQTLELTGALMKEFGTNITSIPIIPWHDGAFDVRVGDELVHAMERDGGFPTNESVIAAVRAQLQG